MKKNKNIYTRITRQPKNAGLAQHNRNGKNWTRGYFYNVDYYDGIPNMDNYGFYSVGKGRFFDEYGKEIVGEPQLLGIFGVATIVGIAGKINQELIIAGIL